MGKPEDLCGEWAVASGFPRCLPLGSTDFGVYVRLPAFFAAEFEGV